MTGLVSPFGGREHVIPLAPGRQMMMIMMLTWLLYCGNALKQIVSQCLLYTTIVAWLYVD